MDQVDWEEFSQKVIENLLLQWILPEIGRRSEKNKIETPLVLRAAQIVFYPDDRPLEIRINEEVRAQAVPKFKPGVEKREGELVYEHELEGLVDLRLTDEDDPNCAHVTSLLINMVWHLQFDFRYNKPLAQKHVELAQNFLTVAEFALSQGLWRPFVDTLYSAAELTVKAQLLIMPDPRILKSKRHAFVQAQFNRFANQGNIETSQKNAFNDLSQSRPKARYATEDFSITAEEAQDLLDSIRQLLTETSQRIAR